MFQISEILSSFFSCDLGSILTYLAGAAMFPLLGQAFAQGSDDDSSDNTADESHECDESCGCSHGNEIDLDVLNGRITELETVSSRTMEQSEELSDAYIMLATVLFEDGEEPDEVVKTFDKAADVLKATLTQGEDEEIRRRLGNVYLHKGVALNDFDDFEQAIKSYDEAIETLKPLDQGGDGEAKFDIAGVQLNRGTIYHEIGDLEKAKIDLDESFMAFRAVEKISTDMDTRFFMAKVSIAQGSLLRDLGEPLDKIVDAYNRAMRLLVELIDIGQMEHERDLANVLMDRCTAIYEDCFTREFESEDDRQKVIDDVLIDVGRGIEILERLAQNGNMENRVDLFSALSIQGSMLLDGEKYEEAYKIFDRAVKEFDDFAEDDDPVVLNQYASALEHRGFAAMNLDRLEEAIPDFDEAIRIRELIQSDEFDLEVEERVIFVPTLATTYANRANAHSSLENKEQAVTDCEHGLELLRSVRDDLEDDFSEVEAMFEALLERLR